MNYDIKILDKHTNRGQIEFDQLSLLTKSTKDIATKALMFKLTGVSDMRPEKHLKEALSMYLDNIAANSDEGTILTVDCDKFSESIKRLQLDFFIPKEDILKMTPMALVIECFQKVLSEDEVEIDLDKPLLKSLSNFKKNFTNDSQIIYLANRGTIAEVRLKKEDFAKIAKIETRIPQPQNEIISGQLDELKVSKKELGLKTEEGLAVVKVGDASMMKSIFPFIGNNITISGKAHYKSNGQLSYIEIKEFWEPGKVDGYFSEKPKAVTAEQQVLFEIKKRKKTSSLKALKALSGILKDEISDEQFEEMKKDIRR